LIDIGLVPVGFAFYYGGERWGAVAVALVIACGLWVAWSSHAHAGKQNSDPGAGKNDE
jgi:hypothetical protein